jgi:hypothetical protein
MDDSKLPPLPEPFMELNREIVPVVYEAWADQMHAYARAALAAAPAPAPLTVDDVVAALSEYPLLVGIAAVDRYEVMQFVRIVERAHGIGAEARAQAQGGKP